MWQLNNGAIYVINYATILQQASFNLLTAVGRSFAAPFKLAFPFAHILILNPAVISLLTHLLLSTPIYVLVIISYIYST